MNYYLISIHTPLFQNGPFSALFPPLPGTSKTGHRPEDWRYSPLPNPGALSKRIHLEDMPRLLSTLPMKKDGIFYGIFLIYIKISFY